MQVNLQLGNFSFFKFIFGTFLLSLALFFPVFLYITLVVIVVGKAHSLGAWLSMWRAGKLNNKYFIWLVFIIVSVSYLGVKVLSVAVLSFVTYLLFSFHFIYDEFDLQEEKRVLGNIISGFLPLLLLFLYLINFFYFNNFLNINSIIGIVTTYVFLEILYVKEINWFFINSKILTLFVVLSFLFNINPINILNVFALYHYVFWFIYPVYKLHKYKREERDGFIMILFIIMLVSTFVYSSVIWGNGDSQDAVRLFLIGTLVHVLSTAPFGYLIGLPKSKFYN